MILQELAFALCVMPSSSVIGRSGMSSPMGMLRDEREVQVSGPVCGGRGVEVVTFEGAAGAELGVAIVAGSIGGGP